jgi:hypothetical protein
MALTYVPRGIKKSSMIECLPSRTKKKEHVCNFESEPTFKSVSFALNNAACLTCADSASSCDFPTKTTNLYSYHNNYETLWRPCMRHRFRKGKNEIGGERVATCAMF